MAALQHGDVKARLKDVINDHVSDSGKSHADDEYVDHDGDGTEGNVTYMCKGDMRQAPYEIGSSQGKAAASIDFDSSKNVVPVTQYVPEAEDHDHYTGMDEAFRESQLYSELPVYERFISKKTRDNADSSSFAGKGSSFPILKAEDVSAALHSIGRAGPGNYSGDTIRANIKKIAKKKGFPLPDSLKDPSESSRKSSDTHDNGSKHGAQGSSSQEADRGNDASRSSSGRRESGSSGSRETLHDSTRKQWKPDGLLLVESAAHFIEPPRLQEAETTAYPIKLISPGRGSSGYYTPEVLKKAAESKVFKAGTQMFWNHDTDNEESQRPEGDLNRLAAVTTTDARWEEAGKDGPGLYATAKVFSDYADKVKEMGPHIGLSIRAGGSREDMKEGPDGKRGVITALNNAHSVDFVTRAGRDGKVFVEGARPEGEDDMDLKEVEALIDKRVKPLELENKQLKEQLAMSGAAKVIREAVREIRLPDASKNKLIARIAETVDSATLADKTKLAALIEAEAVIERDFLIDLGLPVHSVGVRMTEKEIEQDVKVHEKTYEQAMQAMTDLFVGPKLPKDGDLAARERRKAARKIFREGRAA